MWSKTFSKTYQGVTKESIWRAWADVNNWPAWDSELDSCVLEGEFAAGNRFILNPKGGPKIKITLTKVVENETFTDVCKFPGAQMIDFHEMKEIAGGLLVTNTISVKGPLAFLWVRLVARNVANSVPQQTDNLVRYVSG